MRQRALTEYGVRAGVDAALDVVDLFCGIGGFSEGARAAGHRVVLAVDCDAALLACHRANHPRCEHLCARLPCALPLPPRGGRWHLHCSPPCTAVSISKNVVENAAEQREALALIAWCVDLALGCGCRSFSLEQVPNPAVVALLDARARAHRGRLAYAIVDAVHAGVPQRRRRLIAGSPAVVANAARLALPRALWRGVDAVVDAPPAGATHVLRNLYRRPDRRTGGEEVIPLHQKIRPISKPCKTIQATGHTRWARANGACIRLFTAREAALVQSFPRDYALPRGKRAALAGVGNAVPPALAAAVLRPPPAAA